MIALHLQGPKFGSWYCQKNKNKKINKKIKKKKKEKEKKWAEEMAQQKKVVYIPAQM